MAIKSIIKDNAEIVGLEITQELIEKLEIYAKELYIAGKESDFERAESFFKACVEDAREEDELMQAACVLARYYRFKGRRLPRCSS